MRHYGFTLIELTIVVAILGLLMGMGITYYNSVDYERRVNLTNARMDVIEDALWKYRRANDKLPYPARFSNPPSNANFGVADSATQDYNAAASGSNHLGGMVPTRTLGLPDEYALDGWGRKIEYVVDDRYVAASAFTNQNFTSTTTNIVVARDSSGTPEITQSGQRAVYVLISLGKNGHGAYLANGTQAATETTTSANELANCRCQSNGTRNAATVVTYVQRPPNFDYSSNYTNYFDDILRFKTRKSLYGGNAGGESYTESTTISTFAPSSW